MKKNRSQILNKDELVYNVKECEKLTKLSRKFPVYTKYMGRPHKFVPNDAHIKETAPGYARNDYGKPFFS